jgi:hypothetical protein
MDIINYDQELKSVNGQVKILRIVETMTHYLEIPSTINTYSTI